MKKTWTVVLEITEESEVHTDVDSLWNSTTVNLFVSDTLSLAVPDKISFRIMEVIPAPYGPQHPDGVFIAVKDGKPA